MLHVETAWMSRTADIESWVQGQIDAFRAQVATLDRDPNELIPYFDVTSEERAGGTEVRLIFEYPSRVSPPPRGAVSGATT